MNTSKVQCLHTCFKSPVDGVRDPICATPTGSVTGVDGVLPAPLLTEPDVLPLSAETNVGNIILAGMLIGISCCSPSRSITCM